MKWCITHLPYTLQSFNCFVKLIVSLLNYIFYSFDFLQLIFSHIPFSHSGQYQSVVVDIAYRIFDRNQCIDGKSASHFHLAWKLAILLERKFPLFARRIAVIEIIVPICVILNMNFWTINCFLSPIFCVFLAFCACECMHCTELHMHISNGWNAPILFKTVYNSNGLKFARNKCVELVLWWLPI